MNVSAPTEAEAGGARLDSGKRILVIWARMPTPGIDAGSLRICNILELLVSMSHRATLVASFPSSWPPYNERLEQDADGMRALGVEIPSNPADNSVEGHLQQFGRRYDMVVLGGEYVAAKHRDAVRTHAPQAVVLFDTEDIHYLRHYREARATGNLRALKRALAAKVRETRAAEQADHTIVVSPDEKTLLERDCPGASVHMVPIIQEPHGCTEPFSTREGILFVGSFQHTPNLDAVKYLMEEIYPGLREKIPGLGCHIIGADPPDFIKDFHSGDVVVTGYVPDLSPYFNQCRVCVAPLRFGAGVKGKVLTGMSFGVPVVGSSIAAEGLHLVEGRHVLVADDPTGFCNAVVTAYEDKEVWNRLSRNGLDILSEHFSFKAVKKKLAELLADAEGT